MAVISTSDLALFMEYFALSVGFHFGILIMIYFSARFIRFVYNLILGTV